MTWQAPRTWASGEIVYASMFNTDVRDNLVELKDGSVDDVAPSLLHRHAAGVPGSRPAAGQAGRLYIDTSAGVEELEVDDGGIWHTVRLAASDGDVQRYNSAAASWRPEARSVHGAHVNDGSPSIGRVWRYNGSWSLHPLPRFGSGRIKDSGNQSLADSTWTRLTGMTTLGWQYGGIGYNPPSGGGHLVENRQAAGIGVAYYVWALVHFASNSTGQRGIRIRRGLGTPVQDVVTLYEPANSLGTHQVAIAALVEESDAYPTYFIEAWQDSGGALNVQAGWQYFGMYRIGRKS